MLKKWMILILVLILAIPAGMAEEQKQKLIEAQEGETAAMQIRSLESDAVVGILGVESELQQRRWEDFSTVFTNFVKKNWDEDVQFSDAIWSNGRWLHLLDMGYVTLQAETTNDTADGLIREVTLTGFVKECASDVQVLTGAAYWAAAQYGEYGKYVMQIVFMEDHSSDWFTKEPFPIWIENGYQLAYGLNDMDCPYGRITFAEDLPTVGGYPPFDPKGMENLQPGQTVEGLLERLKAAAESGPMSNLITEPALPETWQDVMNDRMYQIVWDDCALLLYTDGEGASLRSVTLSCMSGDTVSACMHLFPLYNAIASPDEDMLSLLSAITGGHGTWEDMCALNPFCVVNGVMMQCDMQEIGGRELPIAYICGAKMINQK